MSKGDRARIGVRDWRRLAIHNPVIRKRVKRSAMKPASLGWTALIRAPAQTAAEKTIMPIPPISGTGFGSSEMFVMGLSIPGR